MADWSYRVDIFDGPTRCGKLELDKATVELPLLFDINGKNGNQLVCPSSEEITGSIEVTEEPENDGIIQEIIRSKLDSIHAGRMKRAVGSSKLNISITSLSSGNREILTDRHSSFIMDDPSSVVKLFSGIKSSGPVHPPIYLPGSGGAKDIEALFYLGVEIFDNIRAVSSALEGDFFTMNGELQIREKKDRSLSDICGCEACVEGEDISRTEWLKKHNTEILRRRLQIAKKMLGLGRLREHVMGIISGDPVTMSIVRKMERGSVWDIHSFTYSSKTLEQVPVTYRDDLFSPEFTLWRRRMAEDYTPLEHKEILLLLPCSARKPYSGSRTHTNIISSLKSVRGWKTACQRMVLTSPLGIVPMELEELYPASRYDIPVSGDWFNEERSFINELSSAVMRKNGYKHIVSYHKDIEQFFPDGLPEDIKMDLVDVHSIAKEKDIRPDIALKQTLTDLIQTKPEMSAFENEVRETLNLIRFSLDIDLQYDERMAVKNTKVGRDLRIGKQPVFKLKNGGPVPYLSGAESIWDMEGQGKRIMIEDFTPKGILFNHGIDSIQGNIRPGDIVFVGSSSGLKAIGRAMLPGDVMRTGIRGPGVKILEHKK